MTSMRSITTGRLPACWCTLASPGAPCVSQLERGRAQLAILEDRHRIAADLHDIVIQRLFAAGMYLEGASAMVTDPKARERVDAAVEAMDTAIKDLRASIFELGSPGE